MIDFDRTSDAFATDIAVVTVLLCCFGSIVGLTMKVQLLKEAPSWAVLLYIIPIVFSVIFCAQKPHIAIRTALLGGPYFLLVLWAFASFQWSNQPALTMRQGLLLICTYMSACVLAMNLSWFRIARILAMMFTAQATISAALALFKPDWGVMTEIYPGAWSGIWSFKQSLGVAMAVGAACVTSYTMLNLKARYWTMFSLLAVVTCGAFSALALTVFAPVLFAALGKSPTLTGRTDIWAALQPYIEARPMLGWGYQAFWTDTSLSSPVEGIEQAMDGFRPPDAHSTPKDFRLQLGIVGITLATLAFARCWGQAIFQAGREPGMVVAIGFLTVFTSICFTEGFGTYPMDSMTLVVQLILIKTAMSLWDYEDARNNRPLMV